MLLALKNMDRMGGNANPGFYPVPKVADARKATFLLCALVLIFGGECLASSVRSALFIVMTIPDT
jgi:hypothetical protein